MICLKEILKISLDEQLLIKYCMTNYLILLKIQNMMGMSIDLPQWFNNLLGKKSATYTGTEIYSENQQLAEELHKLIIRKF